MTTKAKKVDPAQEVSNVLEDIRPIIQDRLEPWKKLQNGLQSRFDDFQNDPSIAHAIYRVYCQEDRQAPLGVENPHIKNEYKIAEEICLNRSGGYKERLGGKINVARRPIFQSMMLTMYWV